MLQNMLEYIFLSILFPGIECIWTHLKYKNFQIYKSTTVYRNIRTQYTANISAMIHLENYMKIITVQLGNHVY